MRKAFIRQRSTRQKHATLAGLVLVQGIRRTFNTEGMFAASRSVYRVRVRFPSA